MSVRAVSILEGGRRETLAIVLIVAAGAVLRLINLNASLWYDEVITLTQSIRLAPAELAVTYGSLNNHVLYTWLAKGAISLFGEEPWALRLPAYAFGVASIAAVWAMLRESGDRWTALAAAALLALSYHHVWFSQNARGYTGLLLFTTLSGIFLHRALGGRNWRDWLAFAACIASAMLIHLSAAFLIAAQGLATLLHGAGALRRQYGKGLAGLAAGPLIGFGVGAVIVLAVFSPMIAGMLETVRSVSEEGATSARQVVAWKNPLWTLFESVRSLGALSIAAPIAAAFIAIGAWRLVRSVPWIAIPYLIHIPLTLAVLTGLSMRVWPRYFFVDIGFLFAALTVGAFAFADFLAARAKLRERIGVGTGHLKSIGLAFMAIASVPLMTKNFARPKQDFAAAFELVSAEIEAWDSAATVGIASAYYNDYLGLDWPAFSTAEEIRSAEAASRRVWIITAFPAHTRAYYPEAQGRLDEGFTKVATFKGTLSGGDVAVYRSNSP